MYQYDRCSENPYDQRIRRIYRTKILELVENSSSRKSKSENFISKFAKYYTPVVCYGALALAFIPPIVLLIMGKPTMWVIGLPSTYFPGNQLSMRTGDQYSFKLLCRNRMEQVIRAFWLKWFQLSGNTCTDQLCGI